jgi:hypothetical protein
VNAAHLDLLKRQAVSKPVDSSGLMTKAKALAELVERTDLSSTPKALQAARDELLDVIYRAEDVGTARAQAASSIAGRLLSQLDDAAAPDDEAPELSRQDRLAWLELDCVYEMQRALGWERGWPPGGMDWLQEQATDVLSAEDPVAAFDRWVAAPPDVPASLGRFVPPKSEDDESEADTA